MRKHADAGLRPLFRSKLRDMFWVAVENPISGGGVPDHHWCYQGVSGWNEYKMTKGIAVKFRPEQPGWHMSYSRAGGRSFIIVRQMNRGTDTLLIYRGCDAIKLQHEGCILPPLLRCEDGPSEWPWNKIGATLTHSLLGL
jgi:hypothetical protein